MALDYKRLVAMKSEPHRFSYTDRDAMLYALSVGFGTRAEDLPFVYERPVLRTVPSMAVVLASTGLLMQTGVNMTKVLHGAQSLTLHRPLPASAEIVAESRVLEAFDRGTEKGAVLQIETVARSVDDDAPLFTFMMTIVARGDGGFGGSSAAPPKPHLLPDREADREVSLQTRDDQALLYRLNGDRNPLHADPAFAARAGFARPILHGLCSYGIACRAVIATACNYDGDRIKRFDARFSAPAYPGDTLATDLWIDGDVVSFRVRAVERKTTVIDNGLCLLGGAI
jgi:acyl dehydratase